MDFRVGLIFMKKLHYSKFSNYIVSKIANLKIDLMLLNLKTTYLDDFYKEIAAENKFFNDQRVKRRL